MKPYILVDRYQCFGETSCLSLQVGEAENYSEKLVNIYQITRRHILEDITLDIIRHENPRSRIINTPSNSERSGLVITARHS
jgi:PIN domain nuclease of toxin-antitoxin system